MVFKNRIVIIGYGIVAQAVLPMLVRHLQATPSQVVVIDFADREPALRSWIAQGLRFVRERVTPSSLARLLSAHAGRGDLIVDLAWSVDFFAIVRWAHENEVVYVNASLESWDPMEEGGRKSSLEKSLYARYTKLLPLRESWRNDTTALVDHGANPGLVSAFVKAGLLDLGEAVLRRNKLAPGLAERLRAARDNDDFAQLARLLEVKVIHCSEWDTQRADRAKSPDEFVSTWSVEAMWDESIAPSELGWGTHENWLPPSAAQPDTGPRNQIVLPQRGLHSWIRSWVPNQEIAGMLVTHGESFGLSHALTVRENGRVVYRPTVHFAYRPCADALVSLHELRARNYKLHPQKRILADDIVAGSDAVGALLMGHSFHSWWTGSILSIEAARRKASGVNATAVQVAAGLLAGVVWALRNPRKGLRLPEDLPHREILEIARPYLGEIVSERSDWTPLSHRQGAAEANSTRQHDPADPWQFQNYAFQP